MGEEVEIVHPRGVLRLPLLPLDCGRIVVLADLLLLPLRQILQLVLIQHPLAMHVGVLVVLAVFFASVPPQPQTRTDTIPTTTGLLLLLLNLLNLGVIRISVE